MATVGNEATARIRHRMRPFGLGAQQVLVLRQLQAMADARVSIEALARAAEVHPKTVQRWLAGRVPHPRNRWEIDDLLSVREEASGHRPGQASPAPR